MSNENPEVTQQSFKLFPKVVNGGIAGIIGVSCVFPLDLIKTRLQNQHVSPFGELMYPSMWDCMKKTVKAEGICGMYRGVAVNFLLISPEKGIKLASNDFFRYHLRTPAPQLPLGREMLAGGSAGFCQVFITTPMELLKIQMQDAGRVAAQAKLEGKTVSKVTATTLALKLLETKGVLGFYHGILPTMLRDVSFSVIYFPLFARLNSLGPRKKDGSGETVFWCNFLSGFVAGLFSAWIVTPLDVVKTRLQGVSEAKIGPRYRDITETFAKTMKYEGPLAFFTGGAMRMMVVAPLFAIMQTIYSLGFAERLLGIKRDYLVGHNRFDDDEETRRKDNFVNVKPKFQSSGY